MSVTSTLSPFSRLSKLGQSVWIDYLSRDLIESGELMRLVREDAVVGVTSNPSIFAEALSQDPGLRHAADRDIRTRDEPKGDLLHAGGSRCRRSLRTALPGLAGDAGARRLRLLGDRPPFCRRP